MEDYLYSSARFRVKEAALINRAQMQRLSEAESILQGEALLAEFGVEIKRDAETGVFLREETLLGRLRRVYDELSEACPNAEFLRLWLYPYDCNNIKAVIKCHARGVDPTELLFDFGTVDLRALREMAETDDFSALEEPFATAAREASDAYAKTGDPQWVDLILDRACFAAMLTAARNSRVELAVRLVEKKIDLVNLLTCVRLLRMQLGDTGRGFLKNALLAGGTLEPELILSWYEGGEAYLWNRLEYSPYEKLALACGEAATLTEIECAADNDFAALVREAKRYPYGAEPLMGYLLAFENESRNLRIILAGFEAGLSASAIRERVRDGYV